MPKWHLNFKWNKFDNRRRRHRRQKEKINRILIYGTDDVPCILMSAYGLCRSMSKCFVFIFVSNEQKKPTENSIFLEAIIAHAHILLQQTTKLISTALRNVYINDSSATNVDYLFNFRFVFEMSWASAAMPCRLNKLNVGFWISGFDSCLHDLMILKDLWNKQKRVVLSCKHIFQSTPFDLTSCTHEYDDNLTIYLELRIYWWNACTAQCIVA